MTTTTSDWVSTNKLLMDICDFDKSLFDTSTLSSDEIRYFNSIIRGFDKQIQFYIDWLDSDEARRIFYENEQYNEEVFEKIEEEIKNIVGDTSLTADEIISRIYDSGLQHGADEIRRTKYYNDATKYGLEFLQDYNHLLIDSVNTDLKKHIQAEIFTGIVAGEGMPEVAQRILDATDNSLTSKTLSARQRAMMIARTETARAMTQGRLQSYANYGVREVKILTAGDENVCAICREAETKIYLITEAGNLVPFHPLCRCSVMAYIRHGILVRNPLENPVMPLLIPSKLNNLFDNTYNFENAVNSQETLSLLHEESFKNKLKGFTNEKDINLIFEILDKFRRQLPNVFIEFGSATLFGRFTLGFGDWNKKEVNIPSIVEEFGKKFDIPILIHNHPYNTIPFPSPEDFETFSKYGVYYGIVTNDLGTFIVRNNNVQENKTNVTDIESKILNIKIGMMEDFKRRYGYEYDKHNEQHKKDINSMIYANSNKYVKQYENVLSEYDMHVIYVKN